MRKDKGIVTSNTGHKGKTLGELFLAMHATSNPVTRSSYRQAIANRLDRLEQQL